MKAALIHLREPNKKILYTFMTRSLYDYIETLIIRFYRFFGDGNADTVAKALGIAISSAYELMQEKDFPTFKVGN